MARITVNATKARENTKKLFRLVPPGDYEFMVSSAEDIPEKQQVKWVLTLMDPDGEGEGCPGEFHGHEIWMWTTYRPDVNCFMLLNLLEAAEAEFDEEDNIIGFDTDDVVGCVVGGTVIIQERYNDKTKMENRIKRTFVAE